MDNTEVMPEYAKDAAGGAGVVVSIPVEIPTDVSAVGGHVPGVE